MTLIALYSGCGTANRASAENAGDEMFAAFDNLLAEFKTVVDDQTAGEKLPTLNQSYDELAVAVQELQVAQQKSYATGGGLVNLTEEVDAHGSKFRKQFTDHKESLPESTLEILQPFFTKMKSGPIK